MLLRYGAGAKMHSTTARHFADVATWANQLAKRPLEQRSTGSETDTKKPSGVGKFCEEHILMADPPRPYFDEELGTEVFPEGCCPRPWTGDDGSAVQCIANGHCGCNNRSRPPTTRGAHVQHG